jgi:hypothetical protein
VKKEKENPWSLDFSRVYVFRAKELIIVFMAHVKFLPFLMPGFIDFYS